MKAYAIWFGLATVGHVISLFGDTDPDSVFLLWCFAAIVIPGLIAIFTGGGNGANCEPAKSDPIIRSDNPGNPDPVFEAAALANQLGSGGGGRNRGATKHVYLADYTGTPAAMSGMHAHQRLFDWLTEIPRGWNESRADIANIIVHVVSEAEQDRIGSTNQLRSNNWHNTAPTAEIEGGTITTTNTKPGAGYCIIAAGVILVIFAGAMGLVYVAAVVRGIPQ